MPRQLLFLELNEINFDSLAFYCKRGELPAFAALLSRHGWTTTISEKKYDDLEPWIQWVTAHTGHTLAEHQVFRLGDIVNHDLHQIWERLEDHGLRVGAISPMNAKHRVRDAAFFVPDPWTPTLLTASPRLKALHSAIAQAVNDNAQSRVTPTSLARLIAGFAAYALPENYGEYVRQIATSRGRPWRRAIVLDMLLADVFVRETRRTTPDFASLFLNAGAHIQHHYLFSAASYSASQRNPSWYVPAGEDPVLEVYAAYDRILGTIQAGFPAARIMLATALHQVPHDRVTFYWRLRRHEKFLRRIGVPFVRVEPRMSRDFLLICADEEQAREAQRRLSTAMAADGERLFEVDNRGNDLFVILSYPHDITREFTVRFGSKVFANFSDDVAFVALKNGEHNGIGYFLDTGEQLSARNDAFPLAGMPGRIMEAMGVGEAKLVKDSAAG